MMLHLLRSDYPYEFKNSPIFETLHLWHSLRYCQALGDVSLPKIHPCKYYSLFVLVFIVDFLFPSLKLSIGSYQSIYLISTSLYHYPSSQWSLLIFFKTEDEKNGYRPTLLHIQISSQSHTSPVMIPCLVSCFYPISIHFFPALFWWLWSETPKCSSHL